MCQCVLMKSRIAVAYDATSGSGQLFCFQQTHINQIYFIAFNTSSVVGTQWARNLKLMSAAV